MVILAALVVLGGCGGGRPPEARARERLASDLALTPDETRCFWSYLTAELDDETIERIADDGLPVVPVAQWGDYVDAALTCTLYDDLVGDGRQPTPAP